jgi:broad specificity phosphatase PhoE
VRHLDLYLIRHGETYWNKEHRLQGQKGTDLNEKGVHLAEVTSEAIKEIPFDLCITSPLLRAKHTAKLMVRDRNIPILEDSRIEEIAFGDWEGLRCIPPELEIPEEQWEVFFRDPLHFVPPKGGESIPQVISRTGEFLTEVIRTKEYEDKTILISTHGCALRAMLNPYYEHPEDFWQGGVPANCAVSHLVVEDGRVRFAEKDRTFYQATEDAWQEIYAAEKGNHEDK